MNAKNFRKNQIDTMLAHLKMALGYCNIYQDIISLEYDPDKEIVICAYAASAYVSASNRPMYKLEINVACDSNSAMIKDVVEQLDKFFG